MNDYEKFVALVNEFGIPFTENTIQNCASDNGNKVVELMTGEGNQPKLKGYNGFASHWVFDKDGKFVAIYHWE